MKKIKKFLSIFLTAVMIATLSLSVTRIPSEASSAMNNNIVINGDFEDSSIIDFDGEPDVYNGELDKWFRGGYNGNSTLYSTEEQYTGAASMKLNAATTSSWRRNSFYYNFAVAANTDYTVSFKYNVKAFGSEFFGGIVTSSKNDLDNDANRIAVFGTTNSIITNFANNEWTEIKRTFNSGENTALRLMFIIKASDEKETTVYLDDIAVTENTNIIKNGDFEDSGISDFESKGMNVFENDVFDKWYRAGYLGSSSAHSTEEKYDGLASMKLSETSDYPYAHTFYYNVKVKENTDYIFDFKYKVTAVDSQVRGGIVTLDRTNLDENSGRLVIFGESNSIMQSAATDGWVECKREFNSGNNTALRIMFMLLCPNSKETTVYIDNINLQVDPENGKIIKNGGFEKGLEYWSNWNEGSNNVNASATVSDPENVCSGDSALKLHNGDGCNPAYPGFYQEFSVESNRNYRIRFVYKGTASWQSRWAITKSGETDFSNARATDKLYTYSDWKTLDKVFNSGDNTKLRLWFRGGIGSELYIDDIVIEEYDKVTPETPVAPEIVSHTASSVTLKETMGMEYSMDGVNYSASPTFTGLFGGTEYSFYQRTVEDELNLPSEKSEPVTCILTVNGDADANGTLEAGDIAIVKKVLLNVNTDYSSDGCDANGDGKIDIRDLVALKKTHALLSTTSFIMSSRNITDYNIVYSGSSETVQNAIAVLNNAVKARVNSELTVLTENTESPAIKLVVNATDYKDSFNIEFVNNDLVITAGDDDYIVSALNTLAKRISEYPQNQTLIITRSYNHSSDWKQELYNYKLLALTFDDAPHYTDVGDNATTKIIDGIKKYRGQATFFCIGNAFKNQGTKLMQYALDNGFELANHGQTHTINANMTKDDIVNDIKALNDYALKTYGVNMKFFRPSGLTTNENVFAAAKELNMPVIGSGASMDDWAGNGTTAEEIKSNILSKAKDGRIILMHADSSVSEVIEEVCEYLYNDGYRFVTMSDLFKYKRIAYDDIPKDRLIGDIDELR